MKNKSVIINTLNIKGAKSRYFMKMCLILLIVTSKREIGRPRVFHFQNHFHITAENDFPGLQMTF